MIGGSRSSTTVLWPTWVTRAKLRTPTPHAPDQAAPRTPTALNEVKPNRRTRAALAKRRPFAADTVDDDNARKERKVPIAGRTGQLGPQRTIDIGPEERAKWKPTIPRGVHTPVSFGDASG